MTTTTVTLTGTGVPLPVPGRAGAGCLVRYGDIALQFDAGRGTVLRLVEAAQPPAALTALFLTHSHIDHVSDIADLAMTRWIFHPFAPAPALPIIAPNGSTADFVNQMFDPYEADIAARSTEVLSGRPTVDLRPFAPTASPTATWRSDDGEPAFDTSCSPTSFRLHSASTTKPVSRSTFKPVGTRANSP